MAGKSALPILAAAGAVAVVASSKKKKGRKSGNVRWGVRVSSDCKSVDVVNSQLFQQFIYGAFNELVEIDPNLSLIQMTDALFGDVAPNCSGFPEEPESADVVELYATIARVIGLHMVHDPRVKMDMSKLLDEATQIAFIDWYRAWRNYPSSDVPSAPRNQIAFSSDLSGFEFGPDWYSKTLKPWLAGASKAGKLESAYEDFVAQQSVMLGKFVVPISRLPQDNEMVIEFLDELDKAFAQALKELG